MGFTEESQTFLVAAYYRELKETFGERGIEAFVHAVKQYGMQRGNRMAQRAIRDGQKLDYITFCRYGEWEPSEEVVAAGKVSKTQIAGYIPDYELHVLTCPWYRGFEKFDSEAGALYCANLDEAINQGFNGRIPFRTVQTMHTADCCIFRVLDAGITPETDLRHRPGTVRGFDYHCADVYVAFATVSAGVFGQQGQDLAARVLERFGQQYGEEMAQKLQQLAGENFRIA